MFEIIKIAKGDAHYPPALLELHDAPKEIYLRGARECLDLPSVAFVGTRRASEHGLRASRIFAKAFAQKNIAVVSGLAFGVDAVSHRGALDAQGKTIAVVGSGIDDASLYPRANLRLGKEILESGGLIISENPPGTHPQLWDFPKRNRIIAALSLATIVVEAPIKSGALITAKYALELGRDVYVVPADALKESAQGSNALIVDGAIPLTDPQLIIKNILPNEKQNVKFDPKPFEPHNQEEAVLWEALKNGPAHVDDLITISKLSASVVQSTLINLELREVITALPAMRYTINKN